MLLSTNIVPWHCSRCGRSVDAPRQGGVCASCHRVLCPRCLVVQGPSSARVTYCRECAPSTTPEARREPWAGTPRG